MKILDVGCGVNKVEGAVGLDISPRSHADVIHDLNVVPYPFDDNEFDLVVANHVVEHVPDVMAFIAELHRITRPGGRIKLLAPHYTNPDWPNDPTHRNHINSYTFDTFIEARCNFEFYTDVRLRPVSCRVTTLNLWRLFGFQIFINLDQRWPSMRFTRKFWEHYLNPIVRGKEIRFEFEVEKDGISRMAANS